MKIAILHNAVADTDSVAERDVLVQVSAVEQALRTLGHIIRPLACTLNLEAVEEALTMDRPEVVFNLVESLGGSDRLAHLAAVLLDDLDLPYTGTPAAAWHLANHKPAAKAALREAGLPTPDWITAKSHAEGEEASLAPPYIIKAVWEHASVGIDDHAIIHAGDGTLVCEQITSRARQLGHACFAEAFIEGREFNLSLIANGDEPRVLPPAEIDFSAFPKGKPRIVGYKAKWDEATFEYASTPRKFDFAESDAPLLDWLRALAVDCWRLLGLAGYARVDFRVDRRGQPWILEVNANPCLSPDAGFAAALARAQVPLEKAVEWILEDAARVGGRGQGDKGTGDKGIGDKGTGDKGTGDKGTGVGRSGVGGRGSKVEGRRSKGGDEDARHDRREAGVPNTEYSVQSARSPDAAKRKKSKPPIAASLRSELHADDRAAVRRIVEATGLFRPAEIDVAVELVEVRLAKGEASGYEFVVAEHDNQVVGYICFGKNTLTVSSFDVFWIAVEPSFQGQGLGGQLLAVAEQNVQQLGGSRIYIETSHRADYQPTRGFYERCGYELEAVLEEFYAAGDSKAIYVKKMVASAGG